MLAKQLALRVAAIALVVTTAARGSDDFAPAISSGDLGRYITWLDLDRAQSIAVRSLHTPYWAAYEELVSAGAATLESLRVESTEADDVVAQVTAYAAARDGIAVDLAGLDAAFLGDVWSVLTEQQRQTYPRVEMHRARQRALPRLHYFLEFTGRSYVDATELFEPMLAGPEAAQALIEQFERTQTALLAKLQAAHDRSGIERMRRWVAAGRPSGEGLVDIARELDRPSVELARRADRALLDAVTTTGAASGADLDAHDEVLAACYPEAKTVIAAGGTVRRALAALRDADRPLIGDALEAARLELAALQRDVVAAVDRRFERASVHPEDFVETQELMFATSRSARDRARTLMAELEAALPRPEFWAAAGSARARTAPRPQPASVEYDALFAWAGLADAPSLGAWRAAYAQAEDTGALDAADGALAEALGDEVPRRRRSWVVASARRAWLCRRTHVGGAPAVDVAALAIMVVGDADAREALVEPALAYYSAVNPRLEERWRRPNPEHRGDVFTDLDEALLKDTWAHREILVTLLPAESRATFDAIFGEVAYPYMLHGVERFESMRARYLDDIEAAPEATARQAEMAMLDGLERANDVVARLVAALRDTLWWFEDADGALLPAGLRPEDTWDRAAKVRTLRKEYEQVVAATALALDRVLGASDATP